MASWSDITKGIDRFVLWTKGSVGQGSELRLSCRGQGVLSVSLSLLTMQLSQTLVLHPLDGLRDGLASALPFRP